MLDLYFGGVGFVMVFLGLFSSGDKREGVAWCAFLWPWIFARWLASFRFEFETEGTPEIQPPVPADTKNEAKP